MARRTQSVTPLGARFDMEADAFLILALSVAAGPVVGWWVLAIGFARYALLLAERVWRWLRVPVPPRYWRKVVAAIQGVSLAVVVSGLLPTAESIALLFAALVLLAESFGQDIVWLTGERRRTAGPSRQRRRRRPRSSPGRPVADTDTLAREGSPPAPPCAASPRQPSSWASSVTVLAFALLSRR